MIGRYGWIGLPANFVGLDVKFRAIKIQQASGHHMLTYSMAQPHFLILELWKRGGRHLKEETTTLADQIGFEQLFQTPQKHRLEGLIGEEQFEHFFSGF